MRNPEAFQPGRRLAIAFFEQGFDVDGEVDHGAGPVHTGQRHGAVGIFCRGDQVEYETQRVDVLSGTESVVAGLAGNNPSIRHVSSAIGERCR